MKEPPTVRVEETPNPAARRYVVNRPVQQQAKGRFFTAPAEADEPLVTTLFSIDGVAAVMLLPNSITVSKKEGAAWETVDEAARTAIHSHFL